jgi:hypothetical protein
MDPTISIIIVAAIAVFTSVTAPLILAHRTERMHRDDQLEVYRREDKVAAAAKAAADAQLEHQVAAASAAAAQVQGVADQAAIAATRLEAAQKETIARTNEVARTAAEANDRAERKLDQIHALVNSDMTAARQSELDQVRVLARVLERIISMTGAIPDPADVEALQWARDRASELEMILADRLVQFHQMEAEQARQAAERGQQ